MKRKYTVLGSGLLLLAFVVWFLTISVPAGVAMDIPLLTGGQLNTYTVYAVTGAAELLLIVPLLVYMAVTRTNIAALMGNRTNWKQNLLALLIGILLVPALSGMDALFSELFRLIGIRMPDTGLLNPANAGQLLAGVAAIGVTAGVVEEPIFRGVLLRGVGSAAGRRAAVVLTALVFSMVHLDVVGAAERFVIGLLLGYMAWRAGAILPGILLHAAFNSTAVGINLFMNAAFPGWNGFAVVPGASADVNGMLTWVLISLPFALAVWGVYRLFARVTPESSAWAARPYARAEVKPLHALPWVASGAAILVLTALMTLFMALPLDQIMDNMKQYMQ